MAGGGYTVVTARVIDRNNQPYVNANFNVVFVNQNGVPGSAKPNLSGSDFQTQIFGAQCDSDGNFSVVLADNNQVFPLPSQWRFSFCSRYYPVPKTRYCFIWQGIITGPIMDISAQLQAVAVLLPFADADLVGPLPINNLMAATNVNTINNSGYDQNWNWQLTGSNAIAGLAISESAPSTNTNPQSVLMAIATRAASTITVFEALAQNGKAGFQVTPQGDLRLAGAATLLFPDILGGPNLSQIHQGPGNLNIAGGAAIDHTNTVWTANNAIASVLQVGSGPGRGSPAVVNGGMELFANNGLTSGSPYTPTPVFGVDGNGVIQSNSLAQGVISWLQADALGVITPIPPLQIVAGAGVTITQLGNGVIRIDVAGAPPVTPQLASITLNPFSVQGGTSSTGTVTLTATAGTGGANVTLSSNSASATVPASVTVAAGAATATFIVTTTAVGSNTTATITGNYGVSQTANLTITVPPTLALSSVSLNPTSVQGGVSSTGTVTLNLAAPVGGTVVTLTSSNTSAAQVPASVTVLAGATTATFTVTTSAVGSNTAVTISGTHGGTQNANLTVNAPVVPQSIYGGIGIWGDGLPLTLSGTQVTLSQGSVLNELQTTAETVGQSWPFPGLVDQCVYLLLTGSSRTFKNPATGFAFPFNPPVTVSLGGRTLYLYVSVNTMYGTVTVEVAT